VKDAQGLAVPGSTVVAVHDRLVRPTSRHRETPFSIPGMRVGGPYTVTASLEALSLGYSDVS